MMTWNSVDLPEPVLPAISACWRVPLPISRYCNLVAPERPMGTRKFLGGFFPPEFGIRRRDLLKRHLDARGILAALAHADAEIRVANSGGGGGSSINLHARRAPVGQLKTVFGARRGRRCFCAVRREQNPAAGRCAGPNG